MSPGPYFIYTLTLHSKGANVELPKGCRWKALIPGTRGFDWKVLQEDPGKYFTPALSWESGSFQDKLSVMSQD